MALGIALRYVLDALRKATNTKMYHFGLVALDRFRNRLKDYPQYCQHVATLPHYNEFPEHLVEVSHLVFSPVKFTQVQVCFFGRN
jgi:CCR4-NOT transcription complex subunit 1